MNIAGHLGVVVIAFGLSPEPLIGTVAPDLFFGPTLIHDINREINGEPFEPYEGISLKIHNFLHSIWVALILGILASMLKYFQIDITLFVTGWYLHVFIDWFTHGGDWHERNFI